MSPTQPHCLIVKIYSAGAGLTNSREIFVLFLFICLEWQQEAVGRCLQTLQFQGLQAAGRQGVQDHVGTDFAPCLQQVPAWGKSLPERSPQV